MSILYRPARAEDLQRAGELVAASINELCERHGFAPMAAVRPPTFARFSLEDDPDGLWVAEDAGEIVGFAFSWACGDLWFLAQLFVSPDRQGCGIGPALLERTLAHAQRSKARTKALITFAFNTVSQGLYMRQGLFPRCSIYNLQVAREAVAGGLHGERLRCVPIESTAAHLCALAQIDVAALGLSRAKHHRFLMADGATRGFLLHAGDECVGYAYVADGHVGPLAVDAASGARCRIPHGPRSGGRERCTAPVGDPSGPMRRCLGRGPCGRNAHHEPDGADGDA